VKVTFYAPSGKYYFDVWYPDGKKVTLGYPTNTSAQLYSTILSRIAAIFDLGDIIDVIIQQISKINIVSECIYTLVVVRS